MISKRQGKWASAHPGVKPILGVALDHSTLTYMTSHVSISRMKWNQIETMVEAKAVIAVSCGVDVVHASGM